MRETKHHSLRWSSKQWKIPFLRKHAQAFLWALPCWGTKTIIVIQISRWIPILDAVWCDSALRTMLHAECGFALWAKANLWTLHCGKIARNSSRSCLWPWEWSERALPGTNFTREGTWLKKQSKITEQTRKFGQLKQRRIKESGRGGGKCTSDDVGVFTS